MPPPDANPRLMPSVLDRLTDPESMGTASAAAGYSEKEMMDAVREDLEDLLNTRISEVAIPPELTEVRDSIATYGLPDLSRYNGTSSEQSAELARVIATVIQRHEPRLKNVRVRVGRGTEHASRSIRFNIEAALNVNPAPPVGFETVLELTTGRALVKPEGGGS
jgi:type VI secretion system protein ImpF